MSYIPNPDDATAPTLSTLAGTAQAEFIALKQKINNVFLKSNFAPGLNQQALSSGLTYVKSLPAGVDTGIMYGYAANITRNDTAATGGTGVSAVAAQLSAIQGDNQNNVGIYIFGFASEAWTSPVNSQAILVGGEASVISQFNANEAALVGFDVVFKNRPDSLKTGAVVQGLGENQYNKFSRGIQITSFGPSTAGEWCGWNKGITFESTSLSPMRVGAGVVRAIAIDMAHMGNPQTDEPWTAWPHSSSLALSEYMSITWDELQFTRTYLDSSNSIFWMFAQGSEPTTTGVIGYDYSNNYQVFPLQVAGGAPDPADASMKVKVGNTEYYVSLTAV